MSINPGCGRFRAIEILAVTALKRRVIDNNKYVLRKTLFVASCCGCGIAWLDGVLIAKYPCSLEDMSYSYKTSSPSRLLPLDVGGERFQQQRAAEVAIGLIAVEGSEVYLSLPDS